MSGHADTIRRALEDHAPPRDGKPGCTYCQGALVALDALVVGQADRIAWLEGEVAGWRIKLAECEERQR